MYLLCIGMYTEYNKTGWLQHYDPAGIPRQRRQTTFMIEWPCDRNCCFVLFSFAIIHIIIILACCTPTVVPCGKNNRACFAVGHFRRDFAPSFFYWPIISFPSNLFILRVYYYYYRAWWYTRRRIDVLRHLENTIYRARNTVDKINTGNKKYRKKEQKSNVVTHIPNPFMQQRIYLYTWIRSSYVIAHNVTAYYIMGTNRNKFCSRVFSL